MNVLLVRPDGIGDEILCLPVASALRRLLPDNVAVQVDGGVHLGTITAAREAGARLLVSGSGIFWAEDPAAAYQGLLAAAGAAIGSIAGPIGTAIGGAAGAIAGGITGKVVGEKIDPTVKDETGARVEDAYAKGKHPYGAYIPAYSAEYESFRGEVKKFLAA
jgi:hypothetical protein